MIAKQSQNPLTQLQFGLLDYIAVSAYLPACLPACVSVCIYTVVSIQSICLAWRKNATFQRHRMDTSSES